MSEITKLYENAGIEPDINYVCDKEPCEKNFKYLNIDEKHFYYTNLLKKTTNYSKIIYIICFIFLKR